MKIAFCTLGCKVNQYETESMRELFSALGYEIVDKEEAPDVFVLNSCTVTAESDRKTRQTLRHWRRMYPDCITVLCGCMAQAFPKAAEKLTEADIVFGNTDHAKIPALVNEFIKTGQRIVAVEAHQKGEAFKTPGIASFSERTRAYMKIEDGCNRFCSYCAIPYGRGRVRSKPLDEIKKEAQRLSQNGYSEIVLVGINLSAYGQDNGKNLFDAVKAVAENEGVLRVRLGSLEPDHMTDELLKNLFSVKEFCPQFHLSLQSGCDETLKRMNRHYDTAFYRDLVSRIRRICPNASVTTDVMVGFAGETEEEFTQSLDFVREMNFQKVHVFSYSKREGTAAAKLPCHLSNATKQARSEKMIALSEKMLSENLRQLVGKTDDVLFETGHGGVYEGYTKNYTRVKVQTKENLTGKILPVVFESVRDDYLMGTLVNL